MWAVAAAGTLKLAGLHTGCFVHLLLPKSSLPLLGHASVSSPLAFEVRTRLRKQGAAIDFLPALQQECVDNIPPPPFPSIYDSSTLLMSRVLVLLGPQGQRPCMLGEPGAFQQTTHDNRCWDRLSSSALEKPSL